MAEIHPEEIVFSSVSKPNCFRKKILSDSEGILYSF